MAAPSDRSPSQRLPVVRLTLLALTMLAGLALFFALGRRTPILVEPTVVESVP
ncbi:MAG: hypothetical protein ACRENB_15130 [Gemmatimonadales bacterium]